MKQKYWLVLGVASLGATQAAACSSKFDSCSEARTCSGQGAATADSGAGSVARGDAGEGGSSNPGVAGSGNAVAGASNPSQGGAGGAAGAAGEVGAAGEAGEAGAAGKPPIPACALDSDCSDHLACDGVETCQVGKCVAGSAPCVNPDPAHCDDVCDESTGAAVCKVRGKDADKDGHFSSACAA